MGAKNIPNNWARQMRKIFFFYFKQIQCDNICTSIFKGFLNIYFLKLSSFSHKISSGFTDRTFDIKKKILQKTFKFLFIEVIKFHGDSVKNGSAKTKHLYVCIELKYKM